MRAQSEVRDTLCESEFKIGRNSLPILAAHRHKVSNSAERLFIDLALCGTYHADNCQTSVIFKAVKALDVLTRRVELLRRRLGVLLPLGPLLRALLGSRPHLRLRNIICTLCNIIRLWRLHLRLRNIIALHFRLTLCLRARSLHFANVRTLGNLGALLRNFSGIWCQIFLVKIIFALSVDFRVVLVYNISSGASAVRLGRSCKDFCTC